MIGAYEAAYNAWRQDPESFWAQAAESIQWYRRWDKVLDTSRPPFYRWFSGGLLNTCYNLLDAHVENGRADQTALIYDSPVTGIVKSYTYRELLNEVATFAGALRQQGVEKRRSRDHLHADGPGSSDRDVGLCTPRRGSFGGFRRLRC